MGDTERDSEGRRIRQRDGERESRANSVQRCKPVTPALGRWREGDPEFKAIMSYLDKHHPPPHLQKKKDREGRTKFSLGMS